MSMEYTSYVIYETRVTPAQKLVLLYLAEHVGGDDNYGYCTYQNGTQIYTLQTEDQFMDALVQMQSIGILVFRKNDDGKIEFYLNYGRFKSPFEQKEKRTAKRKKTKPGYVYLIDEINGIHHKIGRTTNPEQRLTTFSVKLPYKVEYVAVIKTDDMLGLERELHEKFSHARVDGEWFLLDQSDIEYFKSLAVQS